jgi:tetratricopeptide (TPR) repeat protein
MGQPNVEHLDHLLASGRLAALAFELDGLDGSAEAKSEPLAGHVRRLRAELARRGAGPLVDLVLHAHERATAGADDASRLVRAAAHRLRQSGAHQSAERVLARLGAEDAAAESLHDELARFDQRMSEAATLLGTHDFAGAATRLEQAAALLGDSDLAFGPRIAAGLARWSAGAGMRARELLGTLAEETRSPVSLAARRAHGIARDVIATLERETGTAARGPNWTFATPGPALSADVVSASSLARLRASIARLAENSHGEAPRTKLAGSRIVLDEKQLPSLLAASCTVFLEEERSTTTGLVRVLGFDPVGRVLLLEDIALRAPYLVSADDQWRRCELFGRGALVTGAELADDPRLVAIDACLYGPNGDVPPQAFIAATMGEAVKANDSLPFAHKLLGGALLRQAIAGRSDIAQVYGWYARTRERFLDAEWPLQLYAEALELEGRNEEAALAWSEAAARDPRDDRNVLGEARLVTRIGWDRRAERLVRRALTLRPDLAVGYARLASLALGAGTHDAARLCAEIATELDSTADAWLVLASVHEASGADQEADAALAAAIRADATIAWPHVRMARRRAVVGRWEESLTAAEAATALDKHSAAAWHALGTARWGGGDVEGAFRALAEGLGRTGDDSLALEALRIAVLGWNGEERAKRIGEVAALRAENASTPNDIARTLHALGHDAEAVASLESAVADQGGALNPSWWLLQSLARLARPTEGQRERLRELGEMLLARAPQFPPVVLLHACHLLDADPAAALAFVETTDSAIAPAALWEIAARALERLNRPDDAATLRARIADVLPEGAVQAAAHLAQIGRHELARDLLLRAETASATTNQDVAMTLASSLAALGDSNGATERYIAADTAKPNTIHLGPAIRAAVTAGRWSDVERLSQAWIGIISRDSQAMASIWEASGACAGALLARGDESGREALLTRAGSHADALQMLVRIERMIGSPHLTADRERLLRVAPGATFPKDPNEENAS